MKKYIYKAVSVLLAAFLLLGGINGAALSFNGTSSASGDGSSTTAATGGYAIPNMITKNSNRAVGYRFTVINNAGSAIYHCEDVFRMNTYTSEGKFYAGYQKFTVKRCKTELKACYATSSFQTSETTANVCHDSDLGLTLPDDTTGLKAWSTESNIGRVLSYVWGISVNTLETNAWAIIAEPIFPIQLQSVWHSLTPTEIAVYGAAKFGAGSNGNSSSNPNSFGFIANYSNRYYPNSLRLTAEYVGLAAADDLTGRTSFANIISNGYGCAIIYGNYLSLKPTIDRWTYYQNSYDGFYVYAYTRRAASLKIPSWTASGGQDDLIWYDATAQNNTVRGNTYNWVLYVAKNKHKNEIGHYATHFYAYAANGESVSAAGSYQPPDVTAKVIRQTDANGFYVYVNTVSASNLSVPVWTEKGGQDDLIWYPALKEANTVDGVTYDWKVYIPFSEHNGELGKYILDFYVKNQYSEGLCAASDTYTPEVRAQLKVESCEVWQGDSPECRDNCLGISKGSTFADYECVNGYPMLGNKLWYSVYFPKEIQNYYVRQSVWTESGGLLSRNVYSNDSPRYDLMLSQDKINKDCRYITVYAKADLLKEDGSVETEGEVYAFYIPVAPTVNAQKVTAYSITGDVQAVGTPTGCSGKVYYGQRIYAEYTVTSENEWASQNHIRGALYEWSGEWKRAKAYDAATGDADLYEDNVGLSLDKPLSKNSSLGLYTVPDSRGCAYGEPRIPFLIWTHWTEDISRTEKQTWINIPVSVADVEMEKILLADKDGYLVDADKLVPGQELTVIYCCKNNSDCTVYVNCYGVDKNPLAGVYAISAGKTVSIRGQTFTVPETGEITLWGGVYLEGAGIYNTAYESNGTNNEKSLACKITLPLRLVAVMPNADYRENTEVITSYWLINDGGTDAVPDDNIQIAFSVYDSKNSKIFSATWDKAVVPAGDKNLYYFKWKVPSKTGGKPVKIKAGIIRSGSTYTEVSAEYGTCLFSEFTTPDTRYEKKKPDGFTVPPIPETERQYATWYRYVYKNGEFIKKQYGICSYTDDNENIFPAETANYSCDNGIYTMPSGYGVKAAITNKTAAVSDYEKPGADACTDAQYITAAFPEFGYKTEQGKCKTLLFADMNYIFPDSDGYGNIHYLPIYFPDGKYSAKIIKSDMWTPAGMLTSAGTSKPIIIRDSLFDDWYISHTK